MTHLRSQIREQEKRVVKQLTYARVFTESHAYTLAKLELDEVKRRLDVLSKMQKEEAGEK